METDVDIKMGVAILKRLARISRGVFQPTNIQPTNIGTRWIVSPEYKWSIQEISFSFRGKECNARIVLEYDYLHDLGLSELNELVRDTGYQYYEVQDEFITIVVLTEEAKKLEKERAWISIPI